MTDRIYSRLFGGIGNQLFQYAAGRALADHLGCELVLDARYLPGLSLSGNGLEHFRKARFVEGVDLPPAKSDGALRYGLWRLLGRRPRFHRERSLGYDIDFFHLKPNTYLHGYWQSERYFRRIEDALRDDLEFTTPLDEANAEMAARIGEAGESVSLHVRRGDYVSSGVYADCPPDYYRRAVAQIEANLDDPMTCFVFSNDPGWARDNLDLGHETVMVDINDAATGHFDLHLQSLCAHNVIANSTFSWWAAWLNRNPERQVVAPLRWFGPKHPGNPDICPEVWNRL